MTTSTSPEAKLIADLEARRPAALARAISIVENQRQGFDTLLGALHPRIGRGRRIGITGPPGAGKSTVTTQLATQYREAGLTVGIVAVDPTSPFTGGALANAVAVALSRTPTEPRRTGGAAAAG